MKRKQVKFTITTNPKHDPEADHNQGDVGFWITTDPKKNPEANHNQGRVRVGLKVSK